MADRRHGRQTPETTSRVEGEDWALDDLSGRAFDHVELVRVDLSETVSTSGLIFDECVFRDVAFDLAKHTGAAFLNCTFARCSFVNAAFTECKLLGSMFDRCTLERVTVEGGDWSFVGLPGAVLWSSSFEDVRMRESDLTGADATGGVLRRCDLSDALTHNAKFDRCDLRGSDVSALDPWNVGLKGARITWEQAVVLAAGLGLDVQPD